MRLSLVVFAALLGGVSAAVAQSSAQFTDSITVTATARPEQASEVAATVDVVTAEAIADRQAGEAIDLLRTLPGLRSSAPGRPARRPRCSRAAPTRATRWCCGTASSSTTLTSAASTGRRCRPTASNGSRSCVGPTRRSMARARSAVSCRSSPGVAAKETVSAARLEGGSNELPPGWSRCRKEIRRASADLAGHLRRGEGEVDNDFYDGEEVDLALDGALGESARLGALLRWGASDLGVPFDYAGQPRRVRRQTFETTSLAVPFSWSRADWQIDAQAARTDDRPRGARS